MEIGQTSSIGVTTAAKISLKLFDGTAGQRVSIRITNISVAFGAIKLYRPDGGLIISSGWSGLTQSYFHSMTLPMTGTYTVLLDPDSSYTGSGNLTLYNVPADVTGTIAIGGSATVTTTVPGQNAVLSFTATAGQKVSLSMSNATLGGPVSILNVYGGLLAPTATASAGAFIESHTLPWTGTYKLLIDPANESTGSVTLTLNNTADVVAPITTDGTPVTVAIQKPGQIARLPFSGTASQRVSLVTSNETVTIGFISYLNPNGSQLYSSAIPTVTHFFEPVTLGATGSHDIVVDPSGTFTGSITLKLYDVPADVTGTMTIGGPVVNITLGIPGQNGQLTFSGTAGQLVSLTDTNGTIAGYTLTIKKPDGSTLASTTTAFMDVQTLPVTGTYSLLVNPTNAATGTANLTLHDATEVTASITPGGSAVTVTTTLPGQNARLSFSGTANQKVSLNTSQSGNLGFIRVYNPDGTLLVNSGSGPLARFVDTWSLPVTGTYSIQLDPQGTATGSVTAQLYDVVDVTGTLTINGEQVAVGITTPGQNGFLTFSGTASELVTVRVPQNGIGSTTVKLFHPNGSTLATGSGPLAFNLPQVTLPVTGTYTVWIDPSGAGTGTVEVKVTTP